MNPPEGLDAGRVRDHGTEKTFAHPLARIIFKISRKGFEYSILACRSRGSDIVEAKCMTELSQVLKPMKESNQTQSCMKECLAMKRKYICRRNDLYM